MSRTKRASYHHVSHDAYVADSVRYRSGLAKYKKRMYSAEEYSEIFKREWDKYLDSCRPRWATHRNLGITKDNLETFIRKNPQYFPKFYPPIRFMNIVVPRTGEELAEEASKWYKRAMRDGNIGAGSHKKYAKRTTSRAQRRERIDLDE